MRRRDVHATLTPEPHEIWRSASSPLMNWSTQSRGLVARVLRRPASRARSGSGDGAEHAAREAPQLCESADGRGLEKHPADVRRRAGGAAQDNGDHKHRRRTPYLTAGGVAPDRSAVAGFPCAGSSCEPSQSLPSGGKAGCRAVLVPSRHADLRPNAGVRCRWGRSAAAGGGRFGDSRTSTALATVRGRRRARRQIRGLGRAFTH